ncbi:MAG: DUF6353 family protein [bacterium]|nr:DUF6353 family protein [bacterium]
MNKKCFRGIARNVRTSMKKHSPEILTGIGIAGMITTAIMAVRATPKALMLIEEKKDEYETDELPTVETVKAAWTCYIPSAIVGGISIFCLIGASSVNLRRNAALATAYALSESALKEYQEKVVETIGEKKEQTVRDSIAKDRINNNPVNQREIIITDKGETLCYDSLSGRYFKSNIDKIKKSINELNRQMLTENYISLNDFYYEIGLDNTKLGNMLGWNVDHGLIDVDFSTQLANGETPCLVLDYQVAPQYDYY